MSEGTRHKGKTRGQRRSRFVHGGDSTQCSPHKHPTQYLHPETANSPIASQAKLTLHTARDGRSCGGGVRVLGSGENRGRGATVQAGEVTEEEARGVFAGFVLGTTPRRNGECREHNNERTGSTAVGAGAPRENRRAGRYTCSLSIKPGGRNALLPAGRGKKKKHTEQIFLETRRGHVSTHGKSSEAVARAIGIGQSRRANRVSVHLGRLSNKLDALV